MAEYSDRHADRVARELAADLPSLEKGPGRRQQVLNRLLIRDDVPPFLPDAVYTSERLDVLNAVLESVRESLAELTGAGTITTVDNVARRAILAAVCHTERYPTVKAARDALSVNVACFQAANHIGQDRLLSGAPFQGDVSSLRARRRSVGCCFLFVVCLFCVY